jgi:hypothetical protein
MESSLPQQKHQAARRRLLITAFVIYGTMIVGILGYFAVFSTHATDEAAVETTGAVAATKPGRYEAVIANWNRYRGKDARADAR